MIYQMPSVRAEEQAALARINKVHRQLRSYVSQPRRWLGLVRRVLSARAIQGSNSIEGYNVSVEDAVAAIEGDQPSEAEREDWEAVLGYRRAMTYVLQMESDPHFRLTPELLRSLHYMMTEYSLPAGPGLWRNQHVWVRNSATGDVVYEAPNASQVPRLIDDLIAQLTDPTEIPAIIRGAMAHLNLVMIHPFRDGNGRMARCLQTLVLAREGLLAQEFSSIEEYLGRNTEEYYRVLGEVGQGRWNPQNDARLWIRFCLKAHFVQASSVLRRVQEWEATWRRVEDLVDSHRLPERAFVPLFDAAMGLRVRNSGYRASLKMMEGEEISNQVASNDLRAMVTSGLLERRGKKRGTYYVSGPPLVHVRNEVRAGRAGTIDTSDLFKTEAA